MAYFRNAQGYYLGAPQVRQGAVGAYTLTGTTEVPLLLQDCIISTDQIHEITDITVSGQSVFASNQNCPTDAFAPVGWLGATGHKSMGIPIASRQQVVVSGSTNLGTYGPGVVANVGFGIGTDPITPAQVVPVNELGGEAMSYVCGLGTVALAAGATAALQCTIRRPVMLGAMVLAIDAGVPDDFVVTGITVNNVQMLSGQAGDNIPLSVFLNTSTDIDGKIIAYPAPLNGQVQITITNAGLVAANASGAIFTIPSTAG